jgi:hypothetical protein
MTQDDSKLIGTNALRRVFGRAALDVICLAIILAKLGLFF